MKKILLATTMLAATAGFAAADVAVSGSAVAGLISTGSDTFLISRVRIGFAGTGTTDGGLSFGASMRADQSGGNSTDTSTTNGSSTVFISGAFGKLTFGDTGNATDSLVGQVSGIGLATTGPLDGFTDVAELDDANKTGVDYSYTSGALTFEIGSGQVDGAANGYKSAAVAYAGGAYSVAVGYEADDTDHVLSVKGTATFGAATVKVKLTQDSRYNDNGEAISVDYAVDPALTVTGAYAKTRDHAKANYGLGVAYNLGGGASVKAGVGSAQGTTVADVGVSLSF